MKLCYRCGEKYSGVHDNNCESCNEQFCVFSHQEISDILNNLVIEEIITEKQIMESGYNTDE